MLNIACQKGHIKIVELLLQEDDIVPDLGSLTAANSYPKIRELLLAKIDPSLDKNTSVLQLVPKLTENNLRYDPRLFMHFIRSNEVSDDNSSAKKCLKITPSK